MSPNESSAARWAESSILTFVKIPWKRHCSDFWRAFTKPFRCRVVFSILLRWLLSERMQGRAALRVTTFSPCVRSVAWRNGAKISTSSFSWLSYLADKHRPLCPWASRRVFRLWGSRSMIASTRRRVEFHRVDMADGMLRLAPNSLKCFLQPTGGMK